MQAGFDTLILNTLQIIVMSALLVEAIAFSFVILKKYKLTKNVVNLYFVILFFDLIIAGIILTIEQLSFIVLGNQLLGRTFRALVLIPTTIAGTIINLIAFHLTYTEHKWKLVIPIIVLILIVDYFMAFAIITGEPWSYVNISEIYYSPEIFLILIICDIPVFFAPIATFFYYSYEARTTDLPNAKRGFFMALGILLFSIPYVFEMIPRPLIVVVSLRSLYIASITILFICFSMPQWFKDFIGLKED